MENRQENFFSEMNGMPAGVKYLVCYNILRIAYQITNVLVTYSANISDLGGNIEVDTGRMMAETAIYVFFSAAAIYCVQKRIYSLSLMVACVEVLTGIHHGLMLILNIVGLIILLFGRKTRKYLRKRC